MKRWLLIWALACIWGVPAAADPVLRWAPADTSIGLGSQTTLAVILDDTLTVRTVELYIDYESSVVSSVSGSPGNMFMGYNLFAGFEEVNTASPGQWHGYCVILGATVWAEGPGELYRWTVQGDVLGTSPLVTVTVKLLPPGGGEYDTVTLTATTVNVIDTSDVPVVATDVPALSLHPNPFNPLTNVVFGLGGVQTGRVDVYDVRGRRVTQLWQGRAPDMTAIPWDGRDQAGRALPSGVYTFLLTGADGRRLSTRGTLLR